MLATERDDGDPAEGEKLPGGNAFGAPVATVMALGGYVFLGFRLVVIGLLVARGGYC